MSCGRSWPSIRLNVIELRLSSAARADLVGIRIYSNQQFGGDTADAYFLGFDDAFDLLGRHPKAGEAKAKLGKGIRCLMHRKHRIFYQVDGEVVLIVRVVHHAMDARRALQGAAG